MDSIKEKKKALRNEKGIVRVPDNIFYEGCYGMLGCREECPYRRVRGNATRKLVFSPLREPRRGAIKEGVVLAEDRRML